MVTLLDPLDTELKLASSAPIALVVEDDVDGAHVAKGLLRLLGYRSRIAVDANEALYALSEGPPSLILMDICLPMMDGVNLIKVARRISGLDAVPVVAMSAVYPKEGPVARVLDKEGVTTFLSKPFTLNALRSAIDGARSAAMRFGPPPTPSMNEHATSNSLAGRVSQETTSQTPAAARPPASAPPASAPPARPSPPEPEPKPAPSAPIRAVQSGDLEASIENSGDVPIGLEPSGPPKQRDDDAVNATDVVGQATIEGRSTMIILEKASKSSVTLRSPDEPLAEGAMLRLEIRHRMAVDDSMQDILIRALGHVAECTELPGKGWRVTIRIAAARPPDAFAHLIDYIERFESFH
jgi:CheY-like chemotaxis protein